MKTESKIIIFVAIYMSVLSTLIYMEVMGIHWIIPTADLITIKPIWVVLVAGLILSVVVLLSITRTKWWNESSEKKLPE